ncbi:MAG: right-handed parallel beta-helix repeat-containing protein [Gemmataceae bacterium]
MWLFPARNNRRPASPVTKRLRLEALEGRVVPSTMKVTSPLDDGSAGTLRSVMALAQSGDKIVFAASLKGQTITIDLWGRGQLSSPSRNLTINGPGGNNPVTIRGWFLFGDNDSPVSTVSLSNLNIVGGGFGGSIVNYGASLSLDHCTLSGGMFGAVGAIANYGGTVTIDHSTLSGFRNVDFGVIKNSYGTVTIDHSTLSDNEGGDASVIYNEGGWVTIDHSTLSNNQTIFTGAIFNFQGGQVAIDHSILSGNFSDDFGAGAIYNADGRVTIDHSTLSDNHAGFTGGAIWSGGSLTIAHSLLFGNQAGFEGGAIFCYSGSLTIQSSIVWGNTAPVGGDLANYGDTTIINSLVGDIANYDTLTIE